MRTAIEATAVNIAKPTNLNAPMIHAFLDNIRYITIELNGLIVYDTGDDVPCDMDKWLETRARFPVGFSPPDSDVVANAMRPQAAGHAACLAAFGAVPAARG